MFMNSISLTHVVHFVSLYDVRQIKVSGYDSHLRNDKKGGLLVSVTIDKYVE